MVKRRKYFIGDEAPRKPIKMLIRQRNVVVCRPVIDDYRYTPLHKQFFKLMQWCRENDNVLTKGDIIAILREKLDISPITREELDHFNTAIFAFRKWLGALAGMVVYVHKEQLTKTGPLEWVYRPLRNKREYMKFMGKHIENVGNAIKERHQENLQLLSMTQRQIEERINQVSNEIDMEVGLPPEKRKRRSRRGNGRQ